MKKIVEILILVLAACLFCASAEGLDIVCTSFPCYDAARSVLADNGSVTMLIKPGSEVHSYDPTPADMLSIAGCDLFVYIGGESDAWVEDLLSSLGEDAPDTLRLFDCVSVREEETVEGMTITETEEDAEYDEHIWTSPINEISILNAICHDVCEIDPENEEKYASAAAACVAGIQELDTEIRALVERASRKEIVVADRFPLLYFVKEYGLDYCAAFPSCSSESEPSAKTIMYLIDRVKSYNIPVVYTLEMSSSRTAETIAAETGCEISCFYSMQNISAEDFDAGETYATLMRRNIEALRKGLN